MEPLAHDRVVELRRRALLLEAERERHPRPARSPANHRPPGALVYPLVVGIALATAVALLLLAASMPLVANGGGRTVETDAAVVERFYAALSEALATGELGALDDAVWPELAVPRNDGENWRLDEFRVQLAALHAAQPGLSLRVEDVVAADGRGVARVALAGVGDSAPLALPDAGPGSETSDRLRIVDGRVTEYAGVLAEATVPRRVMSSVVAQRRVHEPLVSGAYWSPGMPRPGTAPTTPPPWVAVDRLELPPGAKMALRIPSGPVLYAVEAGEVAVEFLVTGSAQTRADPRWLTAGEETAVEAGTGHLLRASRAEGATVLALEVMPDPAAATARLRTTNTPERGLVVSPLIWEPTAGARPDGTLAIALHRVTLPPGRYHLARPAASEVVVAVESGQAVVAAPSGALATGTPEEGPALLGAGSAEVRGPGTPIVVHNVGAESLALLLLTMTPGAEPATASQGGDAESTDPAPAPAAAISPDIYAASWHAAVLANEEHALPAAPATPPPGVATPILVIPPAPTPVRSTCPDCQRRGYHGHAR
jgi:hypothetical protein